MLRHTAIGTAILFLLCGTAQAEEKASKANASATQRGAIAPPAQKVAFFSKILVDNFSTTYNLELHLRATLSDSDGKPLGGKMITFTINPGPTSTKATSVTDPAGVATWTNSGANYFKLEPGTYVIEARFTGDAAAPAAAHKGQLTIQKAPSMLKNIRVTEFYGSHWIDVNPVKMRVTYLITGELLQAENIGITNVQVAISANGISVKNCSTVNNEFGLGQITQCDWTPPVNASPADYTMTFKFEGNNRYLPATALKNVRAVP